MNIFISRKNEITIKSIQRKFKKVFPNKKMPTANDVVDTLLEVYAQVYLQIPVKYEEPKEEKPTE